MTNGGKVALAAGVAFAGFLLYSTLSSQRVECTVTVEFNGMSNSATASAASEKEAEQQARTTACGTMAGGMSESIACAATQPVSKVCRPK